jgi:thiol-disulfide isomerase/thioredoxin
MMQSKTAMFAGLLVALTATMATAQLNNYSEQAQKCTSAFQANLSKISTDSLPSVLFRRMEDLRACFIGLEFPDFEMTAIEGKSYRLSDFKEKVVMLNFWFIGCAPCVAEIPMLNQLANEYRNEDFLLLSFCTDQKESILRFQEKHPITFPVFERSRPVIDSVFHLSFGYPTNIILDKSGKIVEFTIGGALEDEKIRATKDKFQAIIDNEMQNKIK